MTTAHPAWNPLVALVEQLGTAGVASNGKISRGQRLRMTNIFDRMTASTVDELNKTDMAQIGKVLMELGGNKPGAKSIKHG